MDMKALFLACRSGDLPKVKFLVDVKEVDINVRDQWDSSPLFYACLCGHEDLVRYLLDNGAKCQSSTFEGERCMYGSLTNAIRNLIRSYKQVTASTMRRDAYVESLRKLLDSGMHSDIVFHIHGHAIPAHRCVLAARSEFFKEMLLTRWRDRSTVTLNNRMQYPAAFRALLSYIYTERLEVHEDDVTALSMLARQCRLEHLVTQLEEKQREIEGFQLTKRGVRVTVVSVEPAAGCTLLQDSLAQLAHLALPDGIGNPEMRVLPFSSAYEQMHPDVIYRVDGLDFVCHKAFFNCRSDYFRALDKDHFNEHVRAESGWGDTSLPVIHLHDVTATVFMHVVSYLYTDKCDLSDESVFEVLHVADLYLLPGLKRYCGQVVTGFIDTDNVVTVLRTSRFFDLPRLEDDCAAFIANNLEAVLQDSEFGEFVREDAGAVKSREETDSIPIIDDIRYHVTTERVQSFSDMFDAEQHMHMIDNFLMDLGLEG